jgi:hypothetical protein
MTIGTGGSLTIPILCNESIGIRGSIGDDLRIMIFPDVPVSTSSGCGVSTPSGVSGVE